MKNEKRDNTKNEAIEIIKQGLIALDTFEKTGNRLQFQAVLDQIETFKNKNINDMKNEKRDSDDLIRSRKRDLKNLSNKIGLTLGVTHTIAFVFGYLLSWLLNSL